MNKSFIHSLSFILIRFAVDPGNAGFETEIHPAIFTHVYRFIHK